MRLDLTAKPYRCRVCETKFGWLESHTQESCTSIQLKNALAENASLKKRLASFIDAWYAQREITGKLAWTMPSLLPDSKSLFYQAQWQRFLDAVDHWFPQARDKSK